MLIFRKGMPGKKRLSKGKRLSNKEGLLCEETRRRIDRSKDSKYKYNFDFITGYLNKLYQSIHFYNIVVNVEMLNGEPICNKSLLPTNLDYVYYYKKSNREHASIFWSIRRLRTTLKILVTWCFRTKKIFEILNISTVHSPLTGSHTDHKFAGG